MKTFFVSSLLQAFAVEHFVGYLYGYESLFDCNDKRREIKTTKPRGCEEKQ